MTKQQKITVGVSRRNLILRLERSLAKDGRELRIHRNGTRTVYLVVETAKNEIAETTDDIEALAHQIGALQPYEVLAD